MKWFHRNLFCCDHHSTGVYSFCDMNHSLKVSYGSTCVVYFMFPSQDLESVVRILLHKGGESNAFIREDVEKALTEMVNAVSPGKSLTALISGGLV